MACVILLGAATSLAAQNTRQGLISQARSEFSDSARIRLLLSAMDPKLGSPDSLWAVAGYELAGVLTSSDRQALASTWLRWIVRHGAAWPMDRRQFTPAMVQAFDQAVAATRATPDTVPTRWEWPARFDAAAPGTVRAVSADPSLTLALTAEGRAEAAAETLRLPAGTYAMRIAADGYESMQLTREVLPGVTTILEVNPVPLLPDAVLAEAAARVLRITLTVENQQVCTNGLLAAADGMALTSLGMVQGATRLQVATAGGAQTFRDIRIAATDPARDLAALRLPAQRQPAMSAAAQVSSGEYAWSVHFDGCGALTSARTRLTDWPAAPTAPVALALPLPAAAMGAPLIDRGGRLIGLVTRPDSVVPAALTRNVLEQGRTSCADCNPAQQPPAQARPKRHFPFVWAGLGAGAVGVTVALLSGGGGHSAPPTTGGIIVTFPN